MRRISVCLLLLLVPILFFVKEWGNKTDYIYMLRLLYIIYRRICNYSHQWSIIDILIKHLTLTCIRALSATFNLWYKNLNLNNNNYCTINIMDCPSMRRFTLLSVSIFYMCYMDFMFRMLCVLSVNTFWRNIQLMLFRRGWTTLFFFISCVFYIYFTLLKIVNGKMWNIVYNTQCSSTKRLNGLKCETVSTKRLTFKCISSQWNHKCIEWRSRGEQRQNEQTPNSKNTGDKAELDWAVN